MAAPARSAAQAARTLSSQAAAPLRPRRANKRTARSSPSAALDSLTELYHLAPTFTPTASPATLSSHLEKTLTPGKNSYLRPHLFDLGDVARSQVLLDTQRVRLDASGSTSTSIFGLEIRQPAVAHLDLPGNDSFDHRESFLSAYTTGSEPPIAKRVRRLIDALHGTTAGGRAGAHTLRESGDKATQWKEGLVKAREQATQQEKEQEREAEDFAKAFEEEEGRRP
ncbi:hypothetical protein JCM6882_000532 [Rhodosporidiobolus microsporus]